MHLSLRRCHEVASGYCRESQPPASRLQDVVMPVGGDGLDLLEHVQSNAVWRSIPVVSAF